MSIRFIDPHVLRESNNSVSTSSLPDNKSAKCGETSYELNIKSKCDLTNTTATPYNNYKNNKHCYY